MEIRDKVVVVTGAASGIGEALVERFAADGALAVVVADRDADGVARVAERMGGTPAVTDVTDESAVKDLIDSTVSAHGAIDLVVHYSVTKNAAVSLAEWISITYGHLGIGVSVLCPQAVETNIKANSPTAGMLPADGSSNAAAVDGVLTAAQLADVVIEGLADERFHILPHPDVAEYVRRKGDDVDRWLGGMRRFQNRLFPDGPGPADWLVG